jgi:hypothetical protein
VRPVYAPALVAFVGGGNFSLGVSFGGGFSGVAWFPLGPRDVYIPGYRCSPRYVQTINVTNTRVVNVREVTTVYNNVYVNRDTRVVNNYTYAHNNVAVTAVSRDTFVNARPVNRGIVRVSADQVQRARVVDSNPVAPVRASYVSSTAKISNARPGTSFAQRPVVARMTPAVSRPAPVYTNQGRPTNQGQFNRAPDNPPAVHNQGQFNRTPGNPPAANGGNNPPQQSRDGYRSFQPPANNSQPPNRGMSNSPNGAVQQQQPRPQQQPQQEVRPQQQQLQQRQQEHQLQQHPQEQVQPRQQQVQPPQQEEQRQYRYTPPQKAREGMYDVHPALNQRQEQTARPQQQAPPRQEAQPSRQQPPPPKQEERHPDNKQDNKKDQQH